MFSPCLRLFRKTEECNPASEISVEMQTITTEDVTLAEERRNRTCGCAKANDTRRNEHMGKSWVRAE